MTRAAFVLGAAVGSLAAVVGATWEEPRVTMPDTRRGPLWEPGRVTFESRRWPHVYTVTAYDADEACTGSWAGGPTASGVMPVAGITVAVDRKVWRLGSCVYILGLGKRIAQDVGGAIKGKHIDLFMGSHNEALAWGRRELVVLSCRN